MSKKITNMPIPPDEHFPYGGYYLRRRLNNGRVVDITIKREYGGNDWVYAQQIKDARKKLAAELEE